MNILKKLSQTQNIFVILALLFGVIILLLTPPFYGFDEPLHFWRAYQISEGHIISERQDDLVGGNLPRSLKSSSDISTDNFVNPVDKLKLFDFPTVNIPLNKNDRTFIDFPNSALYSPVPYFPQSVGILIGQALDLSPLFLVYLGRLFNLIMWILLVYYAIKITPVFKNVFFLLALTPITLYQSSSLSADPVTNGLSLLLVALLLKYSYDENKVFRARDILLFIAVASLIALSKQAYLILVLLFMLMPFKRLGSIKKYLLVFGLIIVSAVFFFGIWTLVIGKVYIPLVEGVSPKDQLMLVLTHPIWFLKVLYHTFASKAGMSLLAEIFGRVLGWPLPVIMPVWLYLSYFFCLVVTALLDGEGDIKFSLKNKMISLLTFLIGFTSVAFLFYLSWTAVGGRVVEGMQGRYFTPFMPLFALIFYNNRLSLNKKYLKSGITVFSVFILSFTLFRIYQTYYL